MLEKITAKDYMAASLVTLAPDTDVMEAIQKLLKNRITAAPVLDNHGNLVGIFGELDCMNVVLKSAYEQSMGGKVSEFMTKDVQKVEKDTSIVDLASLFCKSSLRTFPVFDDVELVGVISRTDVLRALTAP